MSRFENIAVFEDTVSVCEKSSRLIESIKTSRNTQIFIGEKECLSDASKTKRFEKEAEIIISKKRTFEAAQDYAKLGEKVAVLNFASSTNPGGGVVNGAGAQEECLCRSSNLYCGLTIPYLLRNYYKANSRTTGDMGTDAVIWSPDVTVFKSDDEVPIMLDTPFEVDVLTCAAPYYDSGKKHPVPMEQLADIFYHRILNILNVAAANDVDSIVLGAFGCGAFNNPPDLVAEAFYRVLVEKQYRDYFRNIVFAIKKNDRDNSNLRAFKDRLSAGSDGV